MIVVTKDDRERALEAYKAARETIIVKCRWEHMTREAVANEWGVPEIAQALADKGERVLEEVAKHFEADGYRKYSGQEVANVVRLLKGTPITGIVGAANS